MELTSNSNNYEHACEYVSKLNWALIPIPFGTKGPTALGWNNPKNTVNDVAGCDVFKNNSKLNMGVLLNASGICVIDIDNVSHTRTMFAKIGIDYDEIFKDAPRLVGNPERDKAIFLAHKDIKLTHKTLSWPVKDGEKNEVDVVIEFRGGAVQDVLPPSIHPDTKAPYIWRKEPFGVIPELPEQLLNIWKEWDKYKPQLEDACPWAKDKDAPASKPTHKYVAAEGDSTDGNNVIEEFNNVHCVEAMLKLHGYTQRTKGARYLSPFSESKIAGVKIFPGQNRAFSHHASEPFDTAKGIDPFLLFCTFEHDGDVKAAVKAAANQLGLEHNQLDPKLVEHGARVAKAFVESLEAKANAPYEWPELEEIKQTLLDVPNAPLNSLPACIKDFMESEARRMCCPPDFIVAPILVMVSSIIGYRCSIRPKQIDNWSVTPSLWGAIVGETGTMKTPAVASALAPLKKLESEANKNFTEKRKQYGKDFELNKNKKAGALLVVKSETKKLISEGKDPDNTTPKLEAAKKIIYDFEETEPPLLLRYRTNDSTVETMGKLCYESDYGILLERDEIMGLFSAWDREDKQSDRAFYLEAWNGNQSHHVDRIGRGHLHIDPLCVSLFGGIQPSVLLKYMRHLEKEMLDDGLMERLQVLVFPDLKKEWKYTDERQDFCIKNRFFDAIKRIVEMDFEAYGAERGEFDDFPFFHFSPGGQEVFKQFFIRLHQLDEDESPAIRKRLAKYGSFHASLALIFYLLDLADFPENIKRSYDGVSENSAKQAGDWCDYFEAHGRRIDAYVSDARLESAKLLLGKIQSNRIQGGKESGAFTLREIYNKGWHMLNTKQQVEDACDELVELNYLYKDIRSSANSKGGRPQNFYIISPRIEVKNG